MTPCFRGYNRLSFMAPLAPLGLLPFVCVFLCCKNFGSKGGHFLGGGRVLKFFWKTKIANFDLWVCEVG